ncbi:MAG: tetratricopeptide repeat protein [Gammaproteobacteria bacterium]|nr:tetratricopeptide repeat protein [Gammaproteobacteria bacterium]
MKNKNSLFRLIALALLLALPGCAMLPPIEQPAAAPASDNSAVVALLETAKQDSDAGRSAAAAASLERALRIEPRNPVLWHELARVRLDEGEPAQAEQLANKSSTLAGNNNNLRADNWRLIGHARVQKGDHKGAQVAFNKAKEIESGQ